MSAEETRSRRVTCCLLGLAGFLLYCFTLFPGVGGVLNHGDSAKFQFLGFVPGVGHPPGNPLYLALLFLVQRVPLFSAALRANLASAATAAVCIGLVADSAYRLAGRRAALLSAAVLALGGLFWEFATEAEVYALSGLFVALIVHALVRADEEHSPRLLAVAWGAFLLGVSNHLSLVVAFPALLTATLLLVRKGLRPSRAEIAGALACAGVSLILYALLPLLHTHSVYSEYPHDLSLETFIDFVTGAKWQSKLGIKSLQDALTTRSIFTANIFLRQWTLALWAAIPLAFSLFLRRSPTPALFCALSAASWIVFLFVYDVPDPDGLVIPIAAAVAPALGVAAATSPRPLLVSALIGLAVAPTAFEHLRQANAAVGYEVLEDVGGEPGRELLDLPDIIERMPPASFFAMPCGHYGCVQVLNYFRFADARTAERKIAIVALRGSLTPRWASSPPSIDPQQARTRVVCTVHERESRLLAARGARMQRIERGDVAVGERTLERLPLYCSTPD